MMLVLMVIVMVALAVLILPASFDQYVRRLPDAPRCPGCRALTRGSGGPGLVAALLPVLATTMIRECSVCGWRGRMRLRFAIEGARGG